MRLKVYFGKVCAKHPELKGERYLAGGRCVECDRENRKARFYANPEADNARCRGWRARNSEHNAVRCRNWFQNNAEYNRLRCRAYYAANRERLLALKRESRCQN